MGTNISHLPGSLHTGSTHNKLVGGNPGNRLSLRCGAFAPVMHSRRSCIPPENIRHVFLKYFPASRLPERNHILLLPHIQISAFGPVYLRLNAGFGPIPENCQHTLARQNLLDIVFGDRVSPIRTLFLDTMTQLGGTERVVENAVLDATV